MSPLRLVIAGTHCGVGKTMIAGRSSHNLDAGMLTEAVNRVTFTLLRAEGVRSHWRRVPCGSVREMVPGPFLQGNIR